MPQVTKPTRFSVNELNNAPSLLGIFIDMKKAFDTMSHVVLLGKFERYGIRGLALPWPAVLSWPSRWLLLLDKPQLQRPLVLAFRREV